MKTKWIVCTALSAVFSCAVANAQTYKSSAGALAVETVVSGLNNPWAIAFLPDGRMLVTERPGRLRIVADGKLVRIAQMVYQSGFNVANSERTLTRDNLGPRTGKGNSGRIEK